MSDSTASWGTSSHALHVEVHDGVAVVVFDLPNEPVNKFNRAVKDEFNSLFDRLEHDNSVLAAVLLSGKKDVWVAGADIEEFLELKSESEAARMSAEGQALLNRLEEGRIPFVAAIHGACLGGGLEAALACAWRIATDHPRTLLALPEVQLGLIPGAGGTQRLPRTVGLSASLDMILTGRNVRAAKAYRMGLVHELVHPAILRDIAITRARELANTPPAKRDKLAQRRAKARPPLSRLLDGTRIGRSIVFRKARERTLEKSRGNYPAPMAAIDAVEAGYALDRKQGLDAEARMFGAMAATSESRELIRIFFASNALKRDPGVPPPVPDAREVHHVAVLGAGFMGAGIAGLAAGSGMSVRLKDSEQSKVASGLAAIRSQLSERQKKGQLTRQQVEDEMSMITGTVLYTGMGRADLVIEAVFEDLAVKQQVLREVERVLPEHAIVATNTSTIPVRSIAQASSRPDRVLGMHFFSPVHRMPLLEIIVTPENDPEVVVTAVACGKKMGKTVVVVKDAPGFYVNRILSPYLNETGILLDQGARIEDIDNAMVAFGFPVGPVTLLDEVGLDIAAKGGAVMAQAFGPRLDPARTFTASVAAGRYGRKNKKGFYHYNDDGTKGDVDDAAYTFTPVQGTRAEIPREEIQSRLVLAMLNEAARCMEEQIVRTPRDGDIAAVFGIGFPPFRGGPFRWMDTVGIAEVARQMEELNHRFPGRFEPADILSSMARHGQTFADLERERDG